MVCLLHAGSAQ